MMNWLKKLFGKSKNKGNPKASLHQINLDGKTVFADDQFVEYLESKLPQPSQKRLSRLLENAIHLQIKTLAENIGLGPLKFDFRWETNDPLDIKKAISLLEIRETEFGHVMCVGSLHLIFKDREGNEICVEHLGGEYLRLQREFRDDAELKRPLEFLQWLSEIGIPEPLESHLELKRDQERRYKKQLDWEAQAPACLVQYVPAFEEMYFNFDSAPCWKALQREIPDRHSLILKLLELYGWGFEPWSPQTMYQGLTEFLLLQLPMPHLYEAVLERELTGEQKEGLAKFLGGFHFNKDRKREVKRVPVEVVRLALEYLESSGLESYAHSFRRRFKNQLQ